MVVRTPNGVQVVDLANRGALVTGWAGEPVSADLSPDGASLAVVLLAITMAISYAMFSLRRARR